MSGGEFISKHYDDLLRCANNIVRANRAGKAKRSYSDDSVELVQLLALHLLQMETQPDNQMGFSLTWMKQQVNWVRTPFEKHTKLDSVCDVYEDSVCPDEASFDKTEREVKLEELEQQGFSPSQAENIQRAKDARSILTEPEKALYDMLFQDDHLMTFREIEALVDVPQSSVYRIYSVMKKKILDYCNKN